MRNTARVQKGLTLKADLAATLQGNVDMREAVKLPAGEDFNEWLAMNGIVFLHLISN